MKPPTLPDDFKDQLKRLDAELARRVMLDAWKASGAPYHEVLGRLDFLRMLERRGPERALKWLDELANVYAEIDGRRFVPQLYLRAYRIRTWMRMFGYLPKTALEQQRPDL